MFWWLLQKPSRWILLFFASAILLPPLPIHVGDSGPSVALLFAGFGLFAGAVAGFRFRLANNPIALWSFLFAAALLESVALAAIYSGPTIAAGSLARVILFAIGPYVFVYSLYCRPRSKNDDFDFTRFLFWLAIGAALFACLDFYFQFPAPAGFGDQYVWLQEGVFRRAQGLFYEASTLGNFCAFFLVMILVSVFCARKRLPCSLLELTLGALLLSTALVLSYSRGSLLNLVTAAAALLYIRRAKAVRLLLILTFGIALVALAIHAAFPAFGENYWLRIQVSFLYFHAAPESILSGRLVLDGAA